MKRYLLLISLVVGVIKAYKLRTAIAVVGVLLGSMALVIVQNGSLSLRTKIMNDVKSIGDRVVTVSSQSPMVPGEMRRRVINKTLKLGDAQALQEVGGVINYAPIVRKSFPSKFQNNYVNVSVFGSTTVFFELRGMSFSEGQPFTAEQIANNAKVAVLGSETKNDLFGNEPAYGKTLLINGTPFEVIGVLESKGSNSTGASLDSIAVIPISTMMSRMVNVDYLNEVLLQIESWDQYSNIAADSTKLLRDRHRLAATKKDDFSIINPIEEQKMQNDLISLANTLGAVSAGVAFFIGAVGIFSLMLLIVTQRMLEIGIKRAIGAKSGDILFQFLAESVFIGTLGGFLGIVVGSLLSALAFSLSGLPVMFSVKGIVFGFTASFLSGIIAGFYPAYKASKVVPVKVLRS